MATTNGTTTTTPNDRKPASRLTKVSKGRLRVPLRYLVYGTHGVGKTTLAASAPEPIFLDIEDGSGLVNVARYSFRDGRVGHVPATYADVLEAIRDLTVSDHPYQTLVIDTLDRLESLLWRHMLDRDSEISAANPKGKTINSIEDYGYGKGYVMAVEEWRTFCTRLDQLRDRRQMSVVLLAHEQIRTFKNPLGEDYDRYQLRINDKTAGFLKEWSDVTAFACFEEDAAKIKGMKSDRPKGFSTGRRMLKFSRTAAFDAKSRIELPEEVEIDIENPWAPFAAAVEAAYESEAKKIADQIAAEVERIGDATLAAKVEPVVKAATEKNDTAALGRYLHDLMKRPAVTKKEGESDAA